LNNCALFLVIPLLTAVCGGGCALGERLERLLSGNPVLLDLQVLALVLLKCLLLVLCDQVVNVGSAVAGGDVPWRSGIEDPVNIISARVFSILSQIRAYCSGMSLHSSTILLLPPLPLLFTRRVVTYSGNLKST
jgi:hypothetical protein